MLPRGDKRPGRVRFAFVLFLVMFFVVIRSARYSGAEEERRPIAVRNVRVFDGEKILTQATVLIENGRISSVGETVSLPPNAEIIEGSDKTLLPGLIDSHVHVWDAQNLRQSLVFGVTAVIDMFTSVQAMAEIKAAQAKESPLEMAFLVSPGILVTVPGGHGTQYGLPIPTITDTARAQDFVDARTAEGSDFIKIILDDGSAYGLTRPTISLEILSAVIKAAHRRSKMAVVHAATLQNCLDSINAGADGLAHLYFDDAFDPDFGRTLARRKAFVIPTLSVLQTMAGIQGGEVLTKDPMIAPLLKPFDLQNLKNGFPFTTTEANYRIAEKALRQLKEAGVPILAGTDAPNPGTTYGASLHRELELLVAAGLSPVEALKAATSIPAATFPIDRRGRIRPGMTADLVLVNGDPTLEIRATRDIVVVWKNGIPVDRAKYLEEAKRERETAASAPRAPVPEYGESGLISDFEGEKIESNFGAGWMVSTDSLRGGKSTARLELVDGGAQGSRKSLLISGNVVPARATNWAGALFSPGPMVMAPADLSSKKTIGFWAKGDGKKYAAMIFARSLGFIPSIQYFEAGPEWQEWIFTFEQFKVQGDDIMGIFIGASGEKGEFAVRIDDVRLK